MLLNFLVSFLTPTEQKQFFYTSNPIFLRMIKCLKISMCIVLIYIAFSTMKDMSKNFFESGGYVLLFLYNLLLVFFGFACAFIVNFIFYAIENVMKYIESDKQSFEVIQELVYIFQLSSEVMAVCKAKGKCTVFDDYEMCCTSGNNKCEEFYTEDKNKRYDDEGEDLTCSVRAFVFDTKQTIIEKIENCRNKNRYIKLDIYKALDRFYLLHIKKPYESKNLIYTEGIFFQDVQEMLYVIFDRYSSDETFKTKVKEEIEINKTKYANFINKMNTFDLQNRFLVDVSIDTVFSYFNHILNEDIINNKSIISYRWNRVYN